MIPIYIEPNTDIYILHNVPLDTTYDHTIWFANVTDQTNYFINMRKYSLSDYSYQRVRRGYMRVGINANNLYDCNYLMFRNTNFGSKWFYAYIKSVEYINNDVSEIEFEIDVMQTWFFDYDLDECFVEREHSATDNIGDNIVPEKVDIGEYVNNFPSLNGDPTLYGYRPLFPANSHANIPFVIIQYVEVNGGAVNGAIYNRVYSGANYKIYRCVNAYDKTAIDTFLAQFASDPDAVVNMYVVPAYLIYGGDVTELSGYSDDSAFEFTGNPLALSLWYGIRYGTGYSASAPINRTNQYPFPVTFAPISAGVTLDGYVPHNNKLYTYPFNFLKIDNSTGNEMLLRYEFFTDSNGDRDLTPKFEFDGTFISPAKGTIMPIYYKGNAGVPVFGEQLTIDEFPECSWNADYYKMWFAQNAVPSVIRSVGNFVAGAVGLGNENVGMKNAIESASNSIANAYQASVKADIGKGNFKSSNVLFTQEEMGIRSSRISVNKNNAQIIDQFFDRFGYATNMLKVPNTHARRRWCYTKTVACTISGSIPSDDARRICDIYNNGITFWRNGHTVCDYSNPATNTPNGEVGD